MTNLSMGNSHLPTADVTNMSMGNSHLPTELAIGKFDLVSLKNPVGQRCE